MLREQEYHTRYCGGWSLAASAQARSGRHSSDIAFDRMTHGAIQPTNGTRTSHDHALFDPRLVSRARPEVDQHGEVDDRNQEQEEVAPAGLADPGETPRSGDSQRSSFGRPWRAVDRSCLRAAMQLAFGVAGVILVVPSHPVVGTRLRRRPNAQWGRSITGSRYARGGPHTPALGWLIPVVVRAAASRATGFAASAESAGALPRGSPCGRGRPSAPPHWDSCSRCSWGSSPRGVARDAPPGCPSTLASGGAPGPRAAAAAGRHATPRARSRGSGRGRRW